MHVTCGLGVAPKIPPHIEMEKYRFLRLWTRQRIAVTEIKENGEVVPVEEGEIVDQKALLT